MLRRKLYSAALLIVCSMITSGNKQPGASAGTKIVAGNFQTISDQPVFTVPGFDIDPAVLQFAEVYIRKNGWSLEKLNKRNRSSLSIINSVFSKYDIPSGLKYMAIVESNLKSDTVCNSTGATGIWQLMPVTASELGLKVNDEVDERLHIYKSSAAAAKYLKQLYAEFGNWLLVIAAYNSGPAKVNRAKQLSGSDNFWKMQNYLPAETRNHVKRFVSILYYFEEQNNTAG